MIWETEIEKKFKLLIAKIPVFHRHIAELAVKTQAESIAGSRNCAQVEEQDVIAAFFADVPSPFYSMMIRILDQAGLDYKKYGYPKNNKI